MVVNLLFVLSMSEALQYIINLLLTNDHHFGVLNVDKQTINVLDTRNMLSADNQSTMFAKVLLLSSAVFLGITSIREFF